MTQATKKPIQVWAIPYNQFTDVKKLMTYMQKKSNEAVSFNSETKSIIIHKSRGDIELRLNNWLLYEINTDHVFWAIDTDIFFKTYNQVPNKLNCYCKKSITNDVFYFKDTSRSTILNVFNFIGLTDVMKYDYLPDSIIDKVQRDQQVMITTLEGDEALHVGEYLVKGINGELYPVSEINFHKVYDLVE